MFTTQQLIGLTFIPASLTGVICNWLVVVAAWRSRSLSHSFSLLTTNQAVFNGIHSTICLLYVSPMIILQSEFLITYSNHCGFFMILCFDAAINAHFIIASNRFCAVYMPITYKRSFSLECTKIIITISFGLSLVVAVVFFYILPCAMRYSPEKWTFLYPQTYICDVFIATEDIGKLISFSVLDLTMDISTMWKSLSQSIYVFIMMSVFCFTPMITDDRIINFLALNIVWCLLHSLNGLCTLVFNSEIRNSLCSVIRISTSEATENSLDAKTLAAKI